MPRPAQPFHFLPPIFQLCFLLNLNLPLPLNVIPWTHQAGYEEGTMVSSSAVGGELAETLNVVRDLEHRRDQPEKSQLDLKAEIGHLQR